MGKKGKGKRCKCPSVIWRALFWLQELPHTQGANISFLSVGWPAYISPSRAGIFGCIAGWMFFFFSASAPPAMPAQSHGHIFFSYGVFCFLCCGKHTKKKETVAAGPGQRENTREKKNWGDME
nr:hypothetical protein [Pandoravirus massiliensis]